MKYAVGDKASSHTIVPVSGDLSDRQDGASRQAQRERQFSRIEPASVEDFSPLRQGFDEAFLGGIGKILAFVARHWLALSNSWLAVFSLTPLLAPILEAEGHRTLAGMIYLAYSATCHQMPERSFFILDQKVAYCQRDVAVYLTMLVGGLVYVRFRDRLRSLDWRVYLAMLAPMVLDGGTQVLGWRESTWELRVITGVLFGIATIWLAYPMFEKAMRDLGYQVSQPTESTDGDPIQTH